MCPLWKVAHNESKCWSKPGNDHLKSEWLRRKQGEKAVPAVQTARNGPEMLMCKIDESQKHEFGFGGLAFPDNQQLLSDPNVWIGNTGAMTIQHLTRVDCFN